MDLPLLRRKRQPPAPVAAPVELIPMGQVRNSITRPRPDGWEHVKSDIVLAEGFAPEMLDGLAGFSHLIVIFLLDRLDASRPRPARVRVGEAPTERGVLATRSQLRPNAIGCSVVRLLEIERGTVRVLGLDALDATPVLDLKPYIPHYDSIVDASVPDWVYGN